MIFFISYIFVFQWKLLTLSIIKNNYIMKHIIIGGVAGGATAAARIRRNDEKAEIVLFEKGKYISYANCGLPYYIGGVIKDRDKLFVQTPASFGRRFNMNIHVNSEVIKINPVSHIVTVLSEDGKQFEESYDKLLLSPGASPLRPPIPGIDSKGIFTLRNVDDTDNIKAYIQSHDVRNAVVVGGGFIGLEMAENLQATGAAVSIVEMAEQVMTPIDLSMAALVHQHLLQKGIRLYLNQAVKEFIPESKKPTETKNTIDVKLVNETVIKADIVILSIGVRPETKLARETGLKIGVAGGISVNNYMQTSDPDIYAVGDAIEFPHPITGKPWLNYLAGPANRQARIVADNMSFGNSVTYEGSIGTSIAKVFDITVATTGLPAKRLKQENIEYISSTTHSNSHAGYYPNAKQMSIKITFAPKTGQLYGGQIVGYNGVDKRIDIIAQIIKNKGTIYDLITIEHAYAPPFSSAKDPTAIAGYVASNILAEKMKIVYWRDIKQDDSKEFTLLDVRTKEEYLLGSISNSINIPVDEIRERMDEIPTNKPIYIFCAIGLRGYLASQILSQNGFREVYNLSGGYKTYVAVTEPISENTPSQNINSFSDSGDPNINKVKSFNMAANTIKVDACGMQCPGPILKLKKSIDSIDAGQRIEIEATDPGFARDAKAWCQTTGNTLIEQTSSEGLFRAIIEKKSSEIESGAPTNCSCGKGKTLILFSDDLDKALATFVLANGASATGQHVSIFFTFWGLNAIKKVKKPKVKKDIFSKMFSMMMPADSLSLKLSKMNMGGMGKKMMRHVMKIRGIDSLESLRQQAINNGVEFIACQMSMDVMGVSREELLDNVTIGGVASYMNRADEANVNLFI